MSTSRVSFLGSVSLPPPKLNSSNIGCAHLDSGLVLFEVHLFALLLDGAYGKGKLH